MVVQLRAHNIFVSLHDKHRVAVVEPRYPVAAVERGKKVIVACHGNQDFLVADHDFTHLSLVPSVTFIDIPDKISESWYEGQVRVTLKVGSMQPSSLHRHASELISGIKE